MLSSGAQPVQASASGRLASIVGWGAYVPERIVTNEELAVRLDSSDEWISSRTGIRQRRFAADGETTSSMGLQAARQALDRAGVSAQDLDLVICASDTPDYAFPATAELIQDQLGAGCGAFDVQAGCSGWVYGLGMASQLIGAGGMERVLVIGAETLSRFLDFQDRSTCVIFGDGAAAAVVQAGSDGYGIRAVELGADGSGAHLIKLPAGFAAKPATLETIAAREHYIRMAGNDVFKFATRVLIEGARRVCCRAGWHLEDVDLFVPHQANIRIIEAAQKRLGLSSEKVFVNLDRYGNTSCASVPLALVEAVESGRLKCGDKVVMVAFGVGLTWAAAAMVWGMEGNSGGPACDQ